MLFSAMCGGIYIPIFFLFHNVLGVTNLEQIREMGELCVNNDFG